MLFNKINLYEELLEQEKKPFIGDSLLKEAKQLLEKDHQHDLSLRARISSENEISNLTLGVLDPQLIFNISSIRNICIKYRLRFLDTKLFKGDIPYDALAKIKALEKEHKIEFNSFKIIAPASLFKLEDKNKDPLLFAQINENEFYLIHKWGNDLSRFRRIWTYPLQDLGSFLISIFVFCLLCALFIPADLLVRSEKFYEYILYYRTMFFSWCFIATFLTAIYFGFSMQKNFSTIEWDSKFIN